MLLTCYTIVMHTFEEAKPEIFSTGVAPSIYIKICTICFKSFETKRRNKNICSYGCKREHVRQHAKFYLRMKRNKSGRICPPCIICGFAETTDQHREGGKSYTLCPNHHCLITRNIRTMDYLLGTVGK